MSNKDQLNKVALTTTENIAKEFLITSTSSIVEGFAKAIPFADTAIALTQAYSNFKSAQAQQHLLAFIQEAENINHGFIKKFFQNTNNTELGFEILGVLDKVYSEKQAKMIGRIAVFKEDKLISKQQFDKYTYIICKLDNYLSDRIEEIYTLYNERQNAPDKNKYPLNSINLQNANMDLLSFDFIVFNQPPHWGDEYAIYLQAKYTVQEDFLFFYENIFKD